MRNMKPPKLAIVMLGFLMKKMDHSCKVSTSKFIGTSIKKRSGITFLRVKDERKINKQRMSRLTLHNKITNQEKKVNIYQGLLTTLIVDKLYRKASCCKRMVRRLFEEKKPCLERRQKLLHAFNQLSMLVFVARIPFAQLWI